jgi:Lipocalin-like domain
MSAFVLKRDRRAPKGPVPTDEEKLNLFDSMLAYAGTYTLDDEKVVHHVDASWNQTWTGTDQVRFYERDRAVLTISTAPVTDAYTGRQVVHRIAFQKLGSGLRHSL